MDLDDLPTPALVLDRGVLSANIARMNERMRRLGVPLRPHLKTAKSADVARLAVAGHPGGVTVSTLYEADYFLERGFADVTYAVGITPVGARHDEVGPTKEVTPDRDLELRDRLTARNRVELCELIAVAIGQIRVADLRNGGLLNDAAAIRVDRVVDLNRVHARLREEVLHAEAHFLDVAVGRKPELVEPLDVDLVLVTKSQTEAGAHPTDALTILAIRRIDRADRAGEVITK